MIGFAARRLARALLVMLSVTVIAQVLLALAPGSPAAVLLGPGATPEAIQQVNQRYGFDRPIPVRYVEWIWSALHGDLGRSYMTNQSVSEAIAQRLPVTAELALLGAGVALIFAVLFALLAASRPGGLVDRTVGALTSAALSIPAFVAAPPLIYWLAVRFGIFPVTGWVPIGHDLYGNLVAATLPALAIAVPEFAVYQRLLRAELMTTLREDFITAARARGLSPAYILLRHALRPSAVSLVTVAAISVGRLLGGTIIVESLFALPGLGSMLSQAVFARDVIVVQGVVAFMAVAYVLINLLVDLSYGLLDPRVQVATTA